MPYNWVYEGRKKMRTVLLSRTIKRHNPELIDGSRSKDSSLEPPVLPSKSINFFRDKKKKYLFGVFV